MAEAFNPMTRKARRLRRNQTEMEKRLWNRLRGRQLKGGKFKRQHPIGPYIVDFLCEECAQVIEVDGGQHSAEGDSERTAHIETAGYRVVRFWNNEVAENMDGVLSDIGRLILERRT
ncbi:MAG: DUF559 domain-containing protein [Alphaproteobacteria bacterium]|nr:DUF559 domain-containing protein [Alphaproteobacteria bacterium]